MISTCLLDLQDTCSLVCAAENTQQTCTYRYTLCVNAHSPWLSEASTRCKGPWEMERLEVWVTAPLLLRWFPEPDLMHP